MNNILEIIKKRGKLKQVFLSDLKEFLNDKKGAEKILQKSNPLIYTVKSIEEYQISYGITKINPGKIGKDYFLTKGHYHKEKSSEVYYLLKGTGLLLLKKEKQKKKIKLKKNYFHYIPEGHSHRVINTGKTPLEFLSIYQTNSNPDYSKIKKQGF